jgi:hypothetical protein
MRGLAKLLMVVGMIALFAAAAYGLSNWWAGEERKSAVVVVVDPPKAEAGVIPLRGRAALYAGEPKEPTDADVAVDEAEEVNLEEAEEPRFELEATGADGSQFFVYAWMELSNFDIYCDSIALPRMRYVKNDKQEGWVDASTGQPLHTLRVPLRKRCAA